MTSMGFVLFTIGVALLLVCRPICAEINCKEDVHTNCFSETLYISKSENGFFSDKFLTEHCSAILEDVDCKANYFHACGDQDNYNLFLLLTQGIKGLFNELCNETSTLREGYRQHIACFENSTQVFTTCIFKSLQSAQKLQNYLTVNNSEINEEPIDEEQVKVKAMCILQKEFRTCSFDEVKSSCGDTAAMYLETIISKAIQDIVNELC